MDWTQGSIPAATTTTTTTKTATRATRICLVTTVLSVEISWYVYQQIMVHVCVKQDDTQYNVTDTIVVRSQFISM